MLNRSMTLLVCLLVLLPQRACMCAGELVSCNDRTCAVAPVEPPVAVPKGKCCKHRHHDEVADALATAEPATHQHERHQSECPSINASLVVDLIKPGVDLLDPVIEPTSVLNPFDVIFDVRPRLPDVVVAALDPPLYLTLQNWRN